jgi:hypothetical protein
MTTSSSDKPKYAGAYFAVLPALPSTPPSKLKEACHELLLTINSDTRLVEAWTHHRVVSLVHPQLPEPLEYLEISAQLRVPDEEGAASSSLESICETIVQALLQRTSVVGNAELLLVLEDTPIPLVDIQIPFASYDSTTEQDSDTPSAKDTFDKYGLVSLSQQNEKLEEQEVNVVDLHAYALQEFERLYKALQIKIQQSQQHTKKQHFREIMARDDYRFDFRLDLDPTGLWKDFEEQGRWKGAVKDILGPSFQLVKCGCVLSLPSCGMQYWHSDGIHQGASASFDSNDTAAPAHALCVFVPLIDLTEETGYTEFWAGSHRYKKLLQKKGEQALPGGTQGLLKKGDALLYDYRTIHRGTSNSSQSARPVCYFLYTCEGYQSVEDQNFVKESVF